MANAHPNKFVYFGKTIFDLTADTVTAATLLSGATAHDKSGALITGTCTFDSDTSEDTVAVAEMLEGKTGHARGSLIVGTMPNKGAVSGVISTVDGTYSIPIGYHDGSGSVKIDTTEQAKIIATNIREGITILGVTGTMTGAESVTSQAATATPSNQQQVITPETGYDYLSQVTIAAIPYTETDNSAGGYTITIG